MELFAASGLINALVSIGLGLLVFYKNWQSKSNRLFFLMTVSLFVWGFFYWVWQSTDNASAALFWVRMLSIGSLFIPIFFYHWIIVLLKAETRDNHLWLISCYAIAFFCLFFIDSPIFIPRVSHKLFFNYWPDAGLLYTIYVFLVYAGLFFYSVKLLIEHYLRETNPVKRGQLFYVLLGAIVGFGGGAFNFPLWFDIPIPPYGTFLVAIFPFLYSYSLVKHKLFNVRAIATEILIFMIVTILMVEAAMSHNLNEFLLKGVFVAAVSTFGYLLIRSTYKEIEQKEENARLAEGLEKANEKLQELDKKKTEFVSMASHQLRSPITAIKGYSSMLTDGSYGDVGPEVAEAAKVINESSQRLLNTIEDFLDVTRIELGTMKYTFSDVDVLELVNKTVEELKPIAERKKVAVSVSSDPGRYVVNSDSGKLSQVIGNLIDNSLKYIPEKKEGETPAEIKIRVYNEPISKTVRVSITDNGIGIDKETMPYLFKRFARSEDAAKVNIRGTGQGLFVAKQLLEAQKGRIWAESPGVGLGTTFYIEMPVKA